MEGLAFIFFWLTPFGFFCTKNGTGLITGTTFLILGFICKYWNRITDTTPTIKMALSQFYPLLSSIMNRYVKPLKIA